MSNPLNKNNDWAICFECDHKFQPINEKSKCPKCSTNDWEYLELCDLCKNPEEYLHDTIVGEICDNCFKIFNSKNNKENIKKYIRKIINLDKI